MENKYYIPAIDEFYVGFEFEIKDPYYEGRENFQKCIIKDDSTLFFPNAVDIFDLEYSYEHLLSNISYDIGMGNIRVKYLDREDIESLGWKLLRENNVFTVFTKTFAGNIYYLKLHSVDLGRVIIEYSTGVHIDIVTKNKSELKKLFSQLGITE